MVAYTDASAQAALDALIATYPYMALFTVVGTDAGTGFTESAYTNYARVSTTGLWAAASGSAPATKSNNANISFPTTGSVGSDIVGWGLYTALTVGVLGFWGYMGNYAWLPASFTTGSPAVVTQPGHGFASGDKLIATAEMGSEGTIAGGWTAGLLTVANVTTDTYTAGVTTANTGGLMIRKVTPQSIVSGMIPRYTTGQITLKL